MKNTEKPMNQEEDVEEAAEPLDGKDGKAEQNSKAKEPTKQKKAITSTKQVDTENDADKTPANEDDKEPVKSVPQLQPLFDADEKKIRPSQRYAPKEKRVIIPSVIPWEQAPTKQSQAGMGAFGRRRNPFTKVDNGSHELKQGDLNSESILSLFAEGNRFASQGGSTPFGGHRKNVVRSVGGRPDVDEDKKRLSDGVIPKQAGSNSSKGQSGETPIGSIRAQVPNVKYKEELSRPIDFDSETFISRLMAPNPHNRAGTSVMDRTRNVVVGAAAQPSREGQGVVGLLWDVKELRPELGHGFQSRRQLVTPTQDVYPLSREEVAQSQRAQSWATGPIVASQEGTGGFQKRRDVVPPLLISHH